MVGKNAENSARVIARVKSRMTAIINRKRPSNEDRQLEKSLVFIWLFLIVIKEILGYRLFF